MRRTLKFWGTSLITALAVLLMGVAFTLLHTPTSYGDDGSARYREGEVLVKFRVSVAKHEAQQLLAENEIEVLDEIEDLGLKKLAAPAGEEEELAKWLSTNELVEYAAPNYIAYAAGQPNDTHWSLQWNMALINAPGGWDIITGSQAITIAILDTGIDLDHPDLAAKLVPGWDYVNSDADPMDDNGHGTHVAGIAAASTNNAMGVAGVDWQARLMPIKVLNSDGNGSYYDIINGIRYAANVAQVINLSMTGWQDFPGLHDAVRYAVVTKGRFVVAAAGNCAAGGTNCLGINPVAYPARYDEVIAVGAVGSNDRWAPYSEIQSYVDLVAPGGTEGNRILSTQTNDTYGLKNGTSMASPHVAGLASLLWALNPSLTRQQVWEVMRDTAVKVDVYPYTSGRNDYCGYGRVDLAAALAKVAPRLIVSPTSISFLAGGNRPLPSDHLTVRNGGGYSSMNWSASVISGATWFEIVGPTSGNLAPGASERIELRPKIAGLQDGTYTGQLRVSSGTPSVQDSPKDVLLTLNYLSQLHLVLAPTVASMAGGASGFDWLDATVEGVALTLPDDGVSKVTLPFDFPFYGQTYDQAWVSSNGFISFGQGFTTFQNRCLPDVNTPNNAIYAFWDDLDPSLTGGVYAKAFGPDTFVVEWANVPHAGPTGGLAPTETFQIVLMSNGTIKLQYRSVGDASSSTVGTENATGTVARQFLCNGVGDMLRDRKVFLIGPTMATVDSQ